MNEENFGEKNQNIRNNFFYSANSEHYQDAFLRWIFYNFR